MLFIGPTGFEPATPSTPRKCATKLRYGPKDSRKAALEVVGVSFKAIPILCQGHLFCKPLFWLFLSIKVSPSLICPNPAFLNWSRPEPCTIIFMLKEMLQSFLPQKESLPRLSLNEHGDSEQSGVKMGQYYKRSGSCHTCGKCCKDIFLIHEERTIETLQ